MDAIPSDTTIEAARKQFEILRRLGPEARLKMAFELSDNLRSLVEAGVRQRHPDFDEQRVQQEVLRLMIGDELFQEVIKETGDRL
ncbi:unnamed protein product [marine sediment metagenome]|uniref:Uncharacterized protein n=1 Tax=marine sediment metagenome TaxID=412755 RepID=X0X2C0_9ZZZZ